MMTRPERPVRPRASRAAPCRAGSYQPTGRLNPQPAIESHPIESHPEEEGGVAQLRGSSGTGWRGDSGPGWLGVGPDPALPVGHPVVVAPPLLVHFVEAPVDRLWAARPLLAGGHPGAVHLDDD